MVKVVVEILYKTFSIEYAAQWVYNHNINSATLIRGRGGVVNGLLLVKLFDHELVLLLSLTEKTDIRVIG